MGENELRERWMNQKLHNPMRAALFSWYDFANESKILLINPQSPALVNYIAGKCKNIHYYCGKANDKVTIYEKEQNINYVGEECFNKKYDYIIAITPFEKEADSKEIYEKIGKWRTCLLPNSKFLLVVDNATSVLRMLGARNTNGRVDTKQVNINFLECFFRNIKTYYIYPDLFFPQEVFTDNFLPSSAVATAVNPYVGNIDEMVKNSFEQYRQMHCVEMPENVAGSFLFECSINENVALCDIDRAKIAAGRGKDSLQTIIRRNCVEKSYVYNGKHKKIDDLLNNHIKLKRRNIPVVECSVKNSTLYMKRIEAILLVDYLVSINDVELIYEIFDKLYEYILKSSEYCESSIWNKKYGEMQYGEILKEAFIEMTPLNCFWGENGLLFFDQEYVKSECPAKYVMYRGIVHFDMVAGNSNKKVNIKNLFDRYGINKDLVAVFEKEERAFLGDICGDVFATELFDNFHLAQSYKNKFNI